MRLPMVFIAAATAGACQSTQTSAPPPAASTADPNRQMPAPAPAASDVPAPTPSATAESKPSTPGKYSFDSDGSEAAPAGFAFGRTGSGKPGQWVVRAVADAPSSPNVLAQVNADSTDYRFPVAVANEPSLRDVRLSVRCKPVSGQVDQACGLVFRYRDQDNYYVTRANALENNVRLYHVVKGDRRQFAG